MQKRNIGAFIILFAVVAGVGSSAVFLLRNALQGETNVDLVEFAMHPCKPLEMHLGRRMVVMRIDDIQGYAWAEQSRRMMTDTFNRAVVPVLGVIPKGLKDDQVTYSFLREHRCNVEIALHGWDHHNETDPVRGEFANLSREEAEELVRQGRSVLEILTREKLTTFIPPNNELSVAGRKLLQDAEFVISDDNGTIFDINAATFNYQTQSINAVDTVLADCEKRWKTSELCVIMTHPQDYTTNNTVDEAKYQSYLQLLDSLKSSGVNFVTFDFLLDQHWQNLKRP